MFPAACPPRTDDGSVGRRYLIRVASHAALFFVLLVTVGGLAASSGMAEMRREKLTLVTRSGSHEFEVEVTATAEDKAKGLMFRRSLAPNAGMLFPYEPPKRRRCG